jgi:hypothetical protein
LCSRGHRRDHRVDIAGLPVTEVGLAARPATAAAIAVAEAAGMRPAEVVVTRPEVAAGIRAVAAEVGGIGRALQSPPFGFAQGRLSRRERENGAPDHRLL